LEQPRYKELICIVILSNSDIALDDVTKHDFLHKTSTDVSRMPYMNSLMRDYFCGHKMNPKHAIDTTSDTLQVLNTESWSYRNQLQLGIFGGRQGSWQVRLTLTQTALHIWYLLTHFTIDCITHLYFHHFNCSRPIIYLDNYSSAKSYRWS